MNTSSTSTLVQKDIIKGYFSFASIVEKKNIIRHTRVSDVRGLRLIELFLAMPVSMSPAPVVVDSIRFDSIRSTSILVR